MVAQLTSRVEAEAPGKVILLGEHAVVHGSTALAIPLPIGIRVVATQSMGPLRLEVPTWRYHVTADDPSDGGQSLANIAAELDLPPKGFRLTADVDLPTSAGLGSSAALAAGIVRALAACTRMPLTPALEFAAIQASEKVFHHNPSGIDAAVVLSNGAVQYSKTSGIVPIQPTSGTAKCQSNLLVIDSGEPGSTSNTVARFAQHLDDDPDEGERRLSQIAQLVQTGTDAFVRGDVPLLGKAMNQNHECLQWFGISTPELDGICKMALTAGAVGAKLTGGGGGGCAIALVEHNRDAAASKLRAAGLDVVVP